MARTLSRLVACLLVPMLLFPSELCASLVSPPAAHFSREPDASSQLAGQAVVAALAGAEFWGPYKPASHIEVNQSLGRKLAAYCALSVGVSAVIGAMLQHLWRLEPGTSLRTAAYGIGMFLAALGQNASTADSLWLELMKKSLRMTAGLWVRRNLLSSADALVTPLMVVASEALATKDPTQRADRQDALTAFISFLMLASLPWALPFVRAKHLKIDEQGMKTIVMWIPTSFGERKISARFRTEPGSPLLRVDVYRPEPAAGHARALYQFRLGANRSYPLPHFDGDRLGSSPDSPKVSWIHQQRTPAWDSVEVFGAWLATFERQVVSHYARRLSKPSVQKLPSFIVPLLLLLGAIVPAAWTQTISAPNPPEPQARSEKKPTFDPARRFARLEEMRATTQALHKAVAGAQDARKTLIEIRRHALELFNKGNGEFPPAYSDKLPRNVRAALFLAIDETAGMRHGLHGAVADFVFAVGDLKVPLDKAKFIYENAQRVDLSEVRPSKTEESEWTTARGKLAREINAASALIQHSTSDIPSPHQLTGKDPIQVVKTREGAFFVTDLGERGGMHFFMLKQRSLRPRLASDLSTEVVAVTSHGDHVDFTGREMPPESAQLHGFLNLKQPHSLPNGRWARSAA
jgi:hypothetical protein